ncbi:MAG: hypothetical protein PUN43_01845 [Candidatus Liberibacter asiaticus]|nr:hypothetical protein [Candidatus Liberibacter asiaticus]
MDDRKYRPSKEEVRDAFPELIKALEKGLSTFDVEPLTNPVKSHGKGYESYISHVCELIELLKNKDFDGVEIERKSYNLRKNT